MNLHAWHWITRSMFAERPAPYWFCAKCGESRDGQRDNPPPRRGCEIEK